MPEEYVFPETLADGTEPEPCSEVPDMKYFDPVWPNMPGLFYVRNGVKECLTGKKS